MSNSSLEEVMKNKIKLAELELRAQFLEQEKEAEMQLKEAEKQLEMTKLERELAVVKAIDRIHLNVSDEDIPRDMVSRHISSDFDYVDQRKTEEKLAFKTTENKEKKNFQLDKSDLKPDAAVFVPGASVNKDGVGNAEMPGKSPEQTVKETLMHKPSIEKKAQRPPPGIANPAASWQNVLCSLLVQQSQCLWRQGMSDLKVETFTADPLRYQSFMTMFETAVETNTQIPKERLAILIEFTSGEPKHLIETCLYQKPSAGYQRANELLKKWHGNPIRVADTYMDKLRSWPRISDRNGKAIIKDFLFSQVMVSNLMS